MSYELIAKGIPVYSINPSKQLDISTIFPNNYPYVLTNATEASVVLDQWSTTDKYREFESFRDGFLKEVNMGSIGNATDMIASHIATIIMQ